MEMELKDKIEKLAETLSPAERACLKLILANAVAENIEESLLTNDTPKSQAFKISAASIGRLQSHKDLVPDNGIVFHGFPEFLNHEILKELQEDAEKQKPKAIRFHDHLVVTDAPIAKKVAFSIELKNLLSKSVGTIKPTGKANYIYYDEKGMGIEPHIDNEDFSLNVILMLKHEWKLNKSALVLYPFNKPIEKLFLSPGELVAFFADSIIHSRERMSEGEKVTIVAFGFKPV